MGDIIRFKGSSSDTYGSVSTHIWKGPGVWHASSLVVTVCFLIFFFGLVIMVISITNSICLGVI